MEIERYNLSVLSIDNKLKTDLEFYPNEKKRRTEYMKIKYATDEEYRNEIKEKKESSYRRKSMLISNNQAQII